jgi:putative transposon-encoded protein
MKMKAVVKKWGNGGGVRVPVKFVGKDCEVRIEEKLLRKSADVVKKEDG